MSYVGSGTNLLGAVTVPGLFPGAPIMTALQSLPGLPGSPVRTAATDVLAQIQRATSQSPIPSGKPPKTKAPSSDAAIMTAAAASGSSFPMGPLVLGGVGLLALGIGFVVLKKKKKG